MKHPKDTVWGYSKRPFRVNEQGHFEYTDTVKPFAVMCKAKELKDKIAEVTNGAG